MIIKPKKVMIISMIVLILTNSILADAKSNEINFKDKNLKNALSKYYNWKEIFTEASASKLSKKENSLVLRNSKISDLEGLQYFDNLTTVYLEYNNLQNLKPLSKLNNLQMLVITDNNIKGKKLENELKSMRQINKLNYLYLKKDGIRNIDFLREIGNAKNYFDLEMENNRISNISIIKEMTNLEDLDLSNNRITDVTPLKNLDKLTSYLDLRDNCIIDYSPIKHLFDKMYKDFDWENGMDRYDYYTNPVNFIYNGQKISFPYLTVYYKYQAYAEAIPLFKSFGGSAKYNKKTGTLTCKYKGDVLVFKDFSDKYTFNGEEKSLEYPMRRMQYDLAYIPVKDICNDLELNYKVVKTRKFYFRDDKYKHAPKLVEINMANKK